MPKSYNAVLSELNHLVLLTYLQPYLQNTGSFNDKRTQISEGANAFLTQTEDERPCPYTGAQLIRAHRDMTLPNPLSEAEYKKYAELITLKSNLVDQINSQFSEAFLELLEKYSTKEEARENINLDNFVDVLAKLEKKEPDIVQKQALFYFNRYFDLKEKINPYQLQLEHYKKTKALQESKNHDILQWSYTHSRNHALIGRLADAMNTHKTIDKAYTTLLTMDDADRPLTQDELDDMKTALCVSAGDLTNVDHNILALLPSLMNDLVKITSHDYADLNASGKPLRMRHEAELNQIAHILFALLVVALVLTTIFTLIPVIPQAAAPGLNLLYSGLFAGSASPVFSFTTIYCISLTFMAAVDLLVAATYVHLSKHGKKYEQDIREKYIAPKLAIKVGSYADTQIALMDKKIDTSARATREPMIKFYGKKFVPPVDIKQNTNNSNIIAAKLQ